MNDPTPFVEANALLAAQEGDAAEVERLVAGLYTSERTRLEKACFAVISAIRNAP